MIKRSKKYLAVLLAGAVALSNITGSIQVSAKIITPEVQEYEIYPLYRRDNA